MQFIFRINAKRVLYILKNKQIHIFIILYIMNIYAFIKAQTPSEERIPHHEKQYPINLTINSSPYSRPTGQKKTNVTFLFFF